MIQIHQRSAPESLLPDMTELSTGIGVIFVYHLYLCCVDAPQLTVGQ
jgi:hypothetical protein